MSKLLWPLTVYRIKLYDPVNQETDTTDIVACSLTDAMDLALHLFNDAMEGPALTIENVVDAQRLTNGALFFTKKARCYLGGVYDFGEPEGTEQSRDKP